MATGEPSARPSRPTDDVAAWVQRAQAGDAAAFRHIYERYVRRVHRAVRALTPNDADAEDATHDAFAIAWERLETYRPRPSSTFASWLMTIAYNVARGH